MCEFVFAALTVTGLWVLGGLEECLRCIRQSESSGKIMVLPIRRADSDIVVGAGRKLHCARSFH